MLKLDQGVNLLLAKDHLHEATKYKADYFLANRHPLEKNRYHTNTPNKVKSEWARVKLSIKSQRQSPQKQRKDLF